MRKYLIGLIHASLKEVKDLAFSPDGMKVASASDDGQVRIYDVSSGLILRILSRGDCPPAECLSWSPDGSFIASGYTDGSVRVWDIRSGRQWKKMALKGKKAAVKSISFNRDGSLLAAGGKNNDVIIWDFASPKSRSKKHSLKIYRRLNHADAPMNAVWTLKFSPSNNVLATGTGRNTGCLVRLWTAEEKFKKATKLKHFSGFKLISLKMLPSVKALDFSPKGEYLVSVGGDKMKGSFIKIWTVNGKQLVTEFGEKLTEFESVAFSASDSIFVTGSYDGILTFWKITGDPLYSYSFPTKINKVLFNKDKSSLAVGLSNGKIEIYDAEGLLIDQGKDDRFIQEQIAERRAQMKKREEEEKKTLSRKLERLFRKIERSIPLTKIAQELRTTVFKAEAAIKSLISTGRINGEFSDDPEDLSKSFVIDKQPSPQIEKQFGEKEISKDSETERERTCFYCGTPIEENSYICSGCGSNLIICTICKKAIVFTASAGECPFCGIKGHLEEFKEYIQSNSECPVCKASIFPEEIIPVSNIAKK